MPQPKAGHLRSLAYLLLAAAIPTIAQQPAAPQQPTPPTLKVTTQLTRVDVTVTDANGHPVHGLPQPAFTIKEDGKPQPLKNFEEFGTQKPSPQPVPPQLPPNVYTNAQPAPPNTSAVNVLLIDDVTTGSGLRMVPENVATSRNEATKYLQTMPAGTQVILIELGVKLRVIQGLTTDRDVLLAALHSITYVQNARTSLPPCPPDVPCPIRLSDLCNVANAQSQAVVDTLDNLSAFLAGIKGRKNLIWFTPGIPWLTNYGNYDSIVCLRDNSGALQRDYNLLAAAQVVINPVDPAGVVYSVPPEGIYPPMAGPVGGVPAPWDHVSMEDMADATGGQAFYNNNDIAALIGKAIATGSDYYSLFYRPPLAKYDGQYHKINVQLDRPGFRLVYRKGYTSLDPEKVASAAAQTAAAHTPDKPAPIPMPDAALHAAMSHGAPPSTQLLFTVAVTPTTPAASPAAPILGQLNPYLKLKGKHLVRYNFKYAVPSDQLTLTNAATGSSGSVEFTVAAYDGTGEMLTVLRQTASFTIPPAQLEAFLRHPLPMLLQLDLPPGPIFLRVALRDLPSNKLGTLEIPLTVPK